MGKAETKLSQHIKMIWDAGDTVMKSAKEKTRAKRKETDQEKLTLINEPPGAAGQSLGQKERKRENPQSAEAAAPPLPAEEFSPEAKSAPLPQKQKPLLQKTIAEKTKAKTAVEETGMADLRSLQAQKFQMMSKMEGEAASQNNPQLQMQLMQSETLHVAQQKITELEEELQSLRHDNEDITSAAEVLKERVDSLMAKVEELNRKREEDRESFADEKGVLVSALEEAKKEKFRLESEKKKLERRLSKDLQSIRIRENSLENRIEIMKWDGAALQRAKDKKIMELQQSAHKLCASLKAAHKKNQELQTQINKMGDSSRKVVAALRATVHNLEGTGFSSAAEDGLAEDSEQDG